jgi:hypothetical protein
MNNTNDVVKDAGVENKEEEIKKDIKQTQSELRKSLWYTYVGEDVGSTTCFCCNSSKITALNFQAGHIIAKANGGETTLENLRPICSTCSSSKGKKNMDVFIKTCGFTKHRNWNGIPIIKNEYDRIYFKKCELEKELLGIDNALIRLEQVRHEKKVILEELTLKLSNF